MYKIKVVSEHMDNVPVFLVMKMWKWMVFASNGKPILVSQLFEHRWQAVRSAKQFRKKVVMRYSLLTMEIEIEE